MTTEAVIRSMIAYLNHLGPMHPCKHGHLDCAIRRGGVCVDEILSNYPDLADMDIGELNDALRE